MVQNRHTINFAGINVDIVDTKGLCDKIVEFVLSGKTHKIMYVNADCMLIAWRNIKYRKILNTADLVYADGIGVVLGAKLFGQNLPGRSTAAGFIEEFCKEFAKKRFRIFFLGAKPGVAQAAAEKLLKASPGLEIAGIQHGYFKENENEKIIEMIKTAKPHVLLVGFGAPKQEIWIEENFTHLNLPVIWGVGGLFDFISGRTRRGPAYLLDNGFEWLCRLCIEPKRLWKRYLIGNFLFLLKVLKWRLFNNIREAS